MGAGGGMGTPWRSTDAAEFVEQQPDSRQQHVSWEAHVCVPQLSARLTSAWLSMVSGGAFVTRNSEIKSLRNVQFVTKFDLKKV